MHNDMLTRALLPYLLIMVFTACVVKFQLAIVKFRSSYRKPVFSAIFKLGTFTMVYVTGI